MYAYVVLNQKNIQSSKLWIDQESMFLQSKDSSK